MTNNMTNLDKTKAEIIYEILLSLNKGDCSFYNTQVDAAIAQYDLLVKRGIIKGL